MVISLQLATRLGPMEIKTVTIGPALHSAISEMDPEILSQVRAELALAGKTIIDILGVVPINAVKP